jgi:Zn-dependent M28 family amino/carboxypeptidase
VLELAHAFRAAGKAPARSILFLLTTAEEKGLVGSSYFAAHPTMPLARVVADINIDGLWPRYAPQVFVARGMEHSSLADDVEAVAKQLGVRVVADPVPEQVIFIRSDQYNFVRRGVPSIFPGLEPASDADAVKDRTWFKENYHHPSDQWSPDFRADWLAAETRFYYLVGERVANARHRPSWSSDSPFAAIRY